jgi:hypothetical protein
MKRGFKKIPRPPRQTTANGKVTNIVKPVKLRHYTTNYSKTFFWRNLFYLSNLLFALNKQLFLGVNSIFGMISALKSDNL